MLAEPSRRELIYRARTLEPNLGYLSTPTRTEASMNYTLALSRAQLDEIRTELQRTLRRLERSMKTDGAPAPREIDQSTVGRLSRIEALQNQGLVRNLQERERVKFDEVLQALGRLDDGTFGRCTGCRSTIEYNRLLVFPETRTCSGCGRGR
jgi:DnaK suppressor protein